MAEILPRRSINLGSDWGIQEIAFGDSDIHFNSKGEYLNEEHRAFDESVFFHCEAEYLEKPEKVVASHILENL